MRIKTLFTLAVPVAAGALALDLFFVRDGVGAAIPDNDARWARMEADLAELFDPGEDVVEFGDHTFERGIVHGDAGKIRDLGDGGFVYGHGSAR